MYIFLKLKYYIIRNKKNSALSLILATWSLISKLQKQEILAPTFLVVLPYRDPSIVSIISAGVILAPIKEKAKIQVISN